LPANGSQLEAPLAALALGDPAFGTRRRAVVVLGRLGGDGSARTLARVLSRDGYALVREAAATALAAVPASLAAPALLEALRSDDESRVRAAAARALGRLGGEPLRAARALPNLTPELRTILSAN
jgi:HEAT repeat protein